MNLKTQYLKDLYKLTITNVKIADDIATASHTYDIGITDMQLFICLGEDTDKYGNTIKNRLVPYSFRVENIQSKCSVCRDILWIFSKNTNELKYDTLRFGNANKLEDLPQSIKEKIDVKRED